MEPQVIRIIRIILVLLALALLIWFIIWLFSPKGSDTADTPVVEAPAQQEVFTTVRYVQDGEITAPEEHYSITISVTNNSRTINVYNGYNTGPIRTKSYANSQASYDAFYGALKNEGYFTSRDNINNLDRTSYCPLGIRYSYQAGNDIAAPNQDTWSASCTAKAGTFAGNKANVKTLFKNQIPDYSEVTKGITL
jgi:hypothetical protein